MLCFSIFSLIIITKFLLTYSQLSTTYEVFETNNDYPRPILLKDDSIIATSGLNGGYMIKYNKNGEVIIPRKQLFNYESNADFKQLKENDKIVMVHGRFKNFNILLFDENDVGGTITYTNYKTDSYKLSLLPLIQGGILVGWTNYEEDKQVKLAKYSLGSDNKLSSILPRGLFINSKQ